MRYTFYSFLCCAVVLAALSGCANIGKDQDTMLVKRQKMVDEQIVARGIRDPHVLGAMREVKRHLFVPDPIQAAAYIDEPLPIGYGQTISQPYIVAYMTEALELKPGDRVLEIGTGSGYQTAVLAFIAKEVYSMELVKALADRAAQRLASLGYKNIEVKAGDGYKGRPEKGPFDAIIVTAAPLSVPMELAEQLKVGGRMIVPVGSFSQELTLITRTDEGIHAQVLIPVRFVPMVRPEE